MMFSVSHLLRSAVISSFLLLAFQPSIQAASQFIKVVNSARQSGEKLLFVISSQSSSISKLKKKNYFDTQKFKVTLNNVNNAVTYFDEPSQSLVGVVNIADMINNWDAINPPSRLLKPNIALHATSPAGKEEVLEVLSFDNPQYNAATNTLTFTGARRSTQTALQARTGNFGATTLFVG